MSENKIHTVIGASGGSGAAVVNALKEAGKSIRAVGRSKQVPGVENVKADLMDATALDKAIAGSEAVYMCAGLPYDTEVWRKQWPVIMNSLIESCIRHQCLLVFLDNMYMYGPYPLPVPFDENTGREPLTEKGKIRKQVTEMLLEASRSRPLKMVIGRCADFYGPGAANSALYFSFLERMLQGKRPRIIAAPDVPHTYTFLPDVGRALVKLASDPSSWGQEWHLPVARPITSSEVVELYNKELNTVLKPQFMGGGMVKILSWFIAPIKEIREMLYQFNQPYVMDDTKFRTKYPDFKVTSIETGIKEMVGYFKK